MNNDLFYYKKHLKLLIRSVSFYFSTMNYLIVVAFALFGAALAEVEYDRPCRFTELSPRVKSAFQVSAVSFKISVDNVESLILVCLVSRNLVREQALRSLQST